VHLGKYQGSNFRRASHKHVLTGIYLTGVHVMDVYPIGMYLTGYISRRRASYGHTYVMGGYPVVVYLMGVDLSGYLTRHTTVLSGMWWCVMWPQMVPILRG
jgi:hypothetical protein